MRRLLRSLSAALLLVAAPSLATGETHANETISTTTSPDANRLEDRVVMLTAERADASVWCMGLLIAPRAVLTYAHCVHDTTKPLAWAFFGHSHEAFDQKISQSVDGDVGDMDPWASIVQTIVHPDYAIDGSSPTTDLAVLQLQEPRVTTDAFSLVANMALLDEAQALDLQAFQMTSNFVTTSRNLKLLPRGTFRKVPWSYCVGNRLPNLVSPWNLISTQPKSQVCTVASVVEDRRSEQLANTFVLLDNKLVGLSVVTNNTPSVAHRFTFLSDQAEFITLATQKTDVWMPVSRLVVGGQASPILKGYVAGLRTSKSGTNFCLGSLVAPKFVLTAAHCVVGVNFTQVSVGSMYVATEVDGEQIKVKRVIVHPNYDAPTFRNDYAIVELEYISIQQPIALFNSSGGETAAGKRLVFYGYGPSVGDTPGQLQSVDLPVVDKKQCKAVLQPPVLDESMLCAGGEEGKDACKGDSGGPLIYQAKSPISLVAMASYGRGCGTKGVPGVYALVATASSFIDKNVEGHRWVKSYASDTSDTTTTSVPPSKSLPTQSKPTTRPPSGPPSTPVVTRLPAQESRSNDAVATPSPSHSGAKPSDSSATVLDEIAANGDWKPVSTILLKDTSPSPLVVGDEYIQLTRDVVATSVLSARSSWASTNRLEPLTKYTGAKAVTFYSSAELDSVLSLVTSFDTRPLRRRKVRFARSESSACSAHR